MNIFFHKAAGPQIPLRQHLLRQSLEAHLRKQKTSAKICEIGDSDVAVSELESVSVFPVGRHVESALFVGLPNAPEKMLGRNFLVCARSLSDELQDFEERNLGNGGASDLWVRNVLSNFDHVILLSRLHFRQSTGLAPFVSLRLADLFPVLLDPVDTADTPEITIFNHGSRPDQEDISVLQEGLSGMAQVTVVSPEATMEPGLDFLARSELHIHVGYSHFTPIAALTPFDSMSCGFYTVLLIDSKGDPGNIGGKLVNEFKGRSYSEIAVSSSEALQKCRKMLERIELLRRQKLNHNRNPEILRFRLMNKAYVDSCLQNFNKALAQ